MRHLPNIITALRILLVLPMGWVIIERQYGLALFLAAVAGLSDAVDGLLARRFDWQSKLGAWLDPAADKLMLTVGFVALSVIGATPWWLTVLVLLRDVVIVLGAAAWRYWRGPLVVEPSRLSKLNTVVQIIYVLVVLLDLHGMLGAPLHLLVWLVAAFTACSGIDYVWHYSRKSTPMENRE